MIIHWGTGCLYNFKLFPHKTYFIEKNSNFMVEKPGKYHPNQVNKVKIKTNGINQYHVPPDIMPWEEHSIASVIFLPKIAELASNHKGTSRKPRLRDILNTRQKLSCILENYPGHEKQRLKTHSRQKTMNETSQVNATCDVILEGLLHRKDEESYQGRNWANGQSMKGSVGFV